MTIIKSALTASVIAFSNIPYTANAAMMWNNTQNTIYYSNDDMQNFLAENGLTSVMTAEYEMHGGYPFPDDPAIMHLYTNPETGRWVISYETRHVSNYYTPMGIETFEEPRHRLIGYGSYFENHHQNHGQERGFPAISNHGLCENIGSPPWFYGNTNMIFRGLDESGDGGADLIYIFTGTGGMQPVQSGFIVRQEAGRGCHWTNRITAANVTP